MIRPPAVSGIFYSSNADKLKKEIASHLKAAETDQKILEKHSSPFAVIVPHAGYQYSGSTAAFAFNILKNYPAEALILIGPSHHAYVEGNSVFTGEAYETPLGRTAVDQEITAELAKKKNMTVSMEAHLPEHSLEVQVPFLQTVCPKAKIVPILIGDYSLSNLELLSANLLEILHVFQKKKPVLVISTDLSHYHNAKTADRMDNKLISHVKKIEIKELIEGLNSNRLEACGSGPLLTALLLAQTLKKKNIDILDYRNSSVSSGDKERVVGYFSAVIS